MRRVTAAIELEMGRYGGAPFFRFLRDPEIEARKKVAFAPHVAHFALTFGDLCKLVLPHEAAGDRFQELVNAHAREDEGHWRWYLKDLELLGEDRMLRLSEAICHIWSDATVRTRRISYELCRFALAGDSLTRLVLVQCIEGAFQVTLAGLLPPASEIARQTGIVLTYMGPGHSDAETSHVLAEREAQRVLAQTELEAARAVELVAMVAEVFTLFAGFADDLLAHCRASLDHHA